MILLDDVQSTAAKPSSRLYKQIPIQVWCIYPQHDQAATLRSVERALDEISKALAQGKYIVAAFAYELGYLLHGIAPKPFTKDLENGPHPLVLAWSFDHYESLSKEQVDDYLKQALSKLTLIPNAESIAGIAHIKNSITEDQFTTDLQTIQEYIRNGDAYQINHTYRVTGQAYGEPLALYMRLRDRQPGRYGAFIQQGENYILSQSPELLIECRDDILKAMPMKGTASAIDSSPKQLSEDPKNQAENVMIVDLLRNDLSQLAVLGSVTVPHLFDVARYGDVLQMTSTVEATAKPGLCLIDLLTAIFPCGSVTGAPKKRSMEIIQELETSERGFYCGALGWFDPNNDFALSVPIRTVVLQKNPSNQASTFTLGIGAGITYSSDIKEEWQECNLKSEFLTGLPSATDLFETILIKNLVAQHLASHLQRLERSAKALGIVLSIEDAQRIVQEACINCSKEIQYRLRLNLASDGTLNYQIAKLDPLTEKVKIFWASDLFDQPTLACMHSGNVLLQHKISHRDMYDRAWQLAVSCGGFDALFTNEQGFVTEGGRSSVFIKPNGSQEWLTPPLSAGVLPGVMRSIILKDPKWNAREANLSVDDLVNATEVMLCNALRGALSAYF